MLKFVSLTSLLPLNLTSLLPLNQYWSIVNFIRAYILPLGGYPHPHGCMVKLTSDAEFKFSKATLGIDVLLFAIPMVLSVIYMMI